VGGLSFPKEEQPPPTRRGKESSSEEGRGVKGREEVPEAGKREKTQTKQCHRRVSKSGSASKRKKRTEGEGPWGATTSRCAVEYHKRRNRVVRQRERIEGGPEEGVDGTGRRRYRN
jgi:hypothetical protein